MEDITLPREKISEAALDQLFREARTYPAWLPDRVPEKLLRELYYLTRLGPTSANLSPARFVFLTTPEAKARLLPAMSSANVEKTRNAPVTVMIAWDTEFYEQLPKLFPKYDMRPMFRANAPLAEETAFRNSSLEAGYFILAARSIGLDCGPMSGFDAAEVNTEFFPDGKWKTNLICNLGYGDPSSLAPRGARLEFDEACQII